MAFFSNLWREKESGKKTRTTTTSQKLHKVKKANAGDNTNNNYGKKYNQQTIKKKRKLSKCRAEVAFCTIHQHCHQHSSLLFPRNETDCLVLFSHSFSPFPSLTETGGDFVCASALPLHLSSIYRLAYTLIFKRFGFNRNQLAQVEEK